MSSPTGGPGTLMLLDSAPLYLAHSFAGWRANPPGGRDVAEGLTWSYGLRGGIVVSELDDEGRIVRQWVIGGTP